MPFKLPRFATVGTDDEPDLDLLNLRRGQELGSGAVMALFALDPGLQHGECGSARVRDLILR